MEILHNLVGPRHLYVVRTCTLYIYITCSANLVIIHLFGCWEIMNMSKCRIILLCVIWPCDLWPQNLTGPRTSYVIPPFGKNLSRHCWEIAYKNNNSEWRDILSKPICQTLVWGEKVLRCSMQKGKTWQTPETSSNYSGRRNTISCIDLPTVKLFSN